MPANPKQPDLLPSITTPGQKPIGDWATAAQLFPFTGCDEPKLRRLGIEQNPATKSPWLPKPIRSRWPVADTLIRLRTYHEHQISAGGSSLRRFASMEDCHRQRVLPKIVLQYAREKGCAGFHDSNRITDLGQILAALFDDLEKIFSGDPQKLAACGVAGLQGIDFHQTRLAASRADEMERLNAVAEKRLHDVNQCEQRLRLELLMPLRDGLQGLFKKFHRLKKSQPGIAAQILETDLPALLTKLGSDQAKMPARKIKPAATAKTNDPDQRPGQDACGLKP